MSLIQLKNIEYYTNQKLLFKINHLNIEENDHIGLIGDNGSGKSSLLKIIANENTNLYTGDCLGKPSIAYVQQLMKQDTLYLSGGTLAKQSMRKALNKNAMLLLADEPDNHLDNESLQYLIKQLQNFNGAFILVSHNRTLLNKACNKIWEIENGNVTAFAGNYEQYQIQKEHLIQKQWDTYTQYDKEKKRMHKNIQQMQTKSKAVKRTPKRMGNSEARLHRMGGQKAKKNIDQAVKNTKSHLEKLEKIDKPYIKKELSISLKETLQIHAPTVLYTKQLSIDIENTNIFKNLHFELETGSKTALIGKNGAGKTVLLNTIFGHNNNITYSKNCKMAYLDQFTKQIQDNENVLENMKQVSIYDEHTNREVLAQLLFKGDDALKICTVLSGGERSRLAIAMLMVSNANVLLLDEVTNHMDLKAIKAVEEALQAYKGTVLFTSHDKVFINNLATNIWEIKNKNLEEIK